jgi:predicted transcriptional regulator
MLEDLWQHVRKNGMVVLELRVCAYTKTARYTFDLDLVNNVMLKDFRGGQSPLRNLAQRGIVDYLNFDMVLASTDMKDMVKRAFINLFESEYATAFDIAHSMHITNQMAANALNAIASRGLAIKEGSYPREIYSINSEALAEKALKLEKS